MNGMRQSASASVRPVPVTEPADATDVVVLRRMGLQDLAFVVDAHIAHFGDGFFARLGPRFLARYYRTFLDGPTAVAIIAENGGTPCGYLAGILHTRQHRALLLRYHGPGLVFRGSAAMLRHPRTGITFVATRLPRYVRSFRRSLKLTVSDRTNAPEQRADSAGVCDPAVLSHVVVSEPRRLRGVGTRLVDHFLDEAAQAGCATASLVTLAEPTGAAAFYGARGWTKRDSFTTPDGKPLWCYTLDLTDDSTG